MDTETKTLKNKVFEAMGAASMCWSETPNGVFDDANACKIGESIMEEIESDLPNAIKVLKNKLSVDQSEGSYYYSWQANIAMSFKDEYERFNPNMSDGNKEILHIIANNAAKNFLNLLIK